MAEEVSLSRNVNICNTQHNVMHLYPKSVCEVLRIKIIIFYPKKGWWGLPHNVFFLISFCSFDPATWGHSPMNIEHVKNSCNINKAKYVQSMERRQSINLHSKYTCHTF
jgi:hypothetical protein